MNKTCIAAVVLAVALTAGSQVFGQTAVFNYNDGVGTPNAGTYQPGDSFSFNITLGFTSGGSIANLEGLSFWLQQQSAGPFVFSLAGINYAGSPFTDLQSPSATFPQAMNPSNASDLGGALPVGNAALGNGTYVIATVTVSISPSAAIGQTYVIDNTLSGGKTSVISDSMGHTFAIPEADYTITLVPEPGTWVGAGLVASLLAFTAIRRRRAQVS